MLDTQLVAVVDSGAHRNTQGLLPGIFSGQEAAELK